MTKQQESSTDKYRFVSVNGSRALVECYIGRRYIGTLKMSLEESERFLKVAKDNLGATVRNKKSPASPEFFEDKK